MKLPHKNIELSLFKKGFKYIAAVDEAGRGPLAGPVVAATVLITEKFLNKNNSFLEKIRDSKTLSEKQREDIFEYLRNDPDIGFKTSYCMPSTIDKINIFEANNKAMQKAVQKLNKKPSIVLVDGNVKIRSIDIEQKTFIKGDQNVFSIACASIIAKVTRDRTMKRYAKKFPEYKFEIHKGYGTQLHRDILKKIGPSPIHRKSFAPVAELL